MRKAIFGEIPAKRVPMKNMTKPRLKIFLFPQRSPIRPVGMRRRAVVRRRAMGIQRTAENPPPRSLDMDGRDTVTILASKGKRKEAKDIRTKAFHLYSKPHPPLYF